MTPTKITDKELWSSLARVINELENSAFWDKLVFFVNQFSHSSESIACIFSQQKAAEMLFFSPKTRKYETQLQRYFSGLYQLDPYYSAFLKNRMGFHTITALAPDDFYQTSYYRRYYRYTNTSDELGYLISIDQDTAIHFSVARLVDHPPYSGEEIRLFRSMEPMLSSAILKHMQLFSSDIIASDKSKIELHDRVNSTINNFGSPYLTIREQEIAQLLLRGHSVKSIAIDLHISVETVRNHRKSIYSKLNIGSHFELFSLFLAAIES